ncbi:hypothetical protein [Kutzneria sp. NPDC052558]|uniref:hypothetical protein n=1 Tax=Kutzneria sp. NPDC052558 TaxID=3364121 RepID=UPI0037C8B7DC
MNHILLLVGVTVVFAAVVLLVLWPTVRSGPRLLRNWGVAESTPEQGRIARLYLLHRRVLYVVLIIVAGLIGGLTDESQRQAAFPSAYFPYIGWLLAALLLGELIAMLRPVNGPVRVATLERRTIRDVLPMWMIIVHLATVVLSVAGILWADVDDRTGAGLPPVWGQVLLVIASAAAVYAVAWLTVARPAAGDAVVDRALRLRSARVVIGIGTMFAATMLAGALYMIGRWHQTAATVGAVALLYGLVMWGVMASAFAFWSGLRGQVPARNG